MKTDRKHSRPIMNKKKSRNHSAHQKKVSELLFIPKKESKIEWKTIQVVDDGSTD